MPLNNIVETVKSAIGVNPNQCPSYRYPLNDIDKYENIVKFTAYAREEKSGSSDYLTTPQFVASKLGSVNLYMPSGLQINDNLSYDNVDTGLGGMLVNSGKNYTNAASASQFLDQVAKDLPDAGDRFVSQMLANASQDKGIVGGAAGQLLINRGEVINPHTQMLFRSPALRQFNFNFKMMARSRAEAKAIKDIVQFFREAAYPSLGTGGQEVGSGQDKRPLAMATYKFPDVFEIQYLSKQKENKNLIKFGRAYITAVTINYNQSSPTFFEDGMPSEVDLSLTFQETKALSREDIQKGY